MFLNDIESEQVIEKLTNKDISYNFLCAGFPCQPFSKAGSQTGLKHKEGKLFKKIIEIIKKYNQNHYNNEIKIVLLENVAYLAKHNNSDTWTTMKKSLKDLGYIFFDEKDKELILNPLNIGIPQNRQRLFLMAFHDSAELYL
ncbi:DNA (cytosine-5-)-methyltransferase [Spiroplasma endosymbiont of Lasioglossum villosulum]|uniref:DNA (cytosine-5-)-methyltransferase n=1 Tax=Spiroplasma endosymbiont of Lasioglossum villosulum TaxID=3066320 RepID=UPI0030D2D26D